MTKIIRRRNFFKQYSNLIMGTLWIAFGTAHLLVNTKDAFTVLSVFYPLVGLLYIILHISQKERNQEFIAWNEEQVILSEWQHKPKIYALEDIHKITLTKSYFILNSSAEGKGKTMELSGYSESDLNLLRARFSPEFVI